MSENDGSLLRQKIRSPRSAAIAGIIFSLLVTTSMLLISSVESPEDFNKDWVLTWFNTASVAIGLVPFAGIAFLWFTGVIRDRLGDREDKMFATVFLGSGIIYVVTIFIWAASFGAIYRIFGVKTSALTVNYDVFIFGFAFMDEILSSLALRMAGVYMLSIGSLWARAGIMPRFVTIITYIVAFGFLILAGTVREAQFGFPAWVFLVSVYILILNYHGSPEEDQ